MKSLFRKSDLQPDLQDRCLIRRSGGGGMRQIFTRGQVQSPGTLHEVCHPTIWEWVPVSDLQPQSVVRTEGQVVSQSDSQ